MIRAFGRGKSPNPFCVGIPPKLSYIFVDFQSYAAYTISVNWCVIVLICERKERWPMSAYTQNFAYQVGKKKDLKQDPSVISPERLAAIKKAAEKYLSDKDKK